jgi:Cytochrome c7 and related cytochrome c
LLQGTIPQAQPDPALTQPQVTTPKAPGDDFQNHFFFESRSDFWRYSSSFTGSPTVTGIINAPRGNAFAPGGYPYPSIFQPDANRVESFIDWGTRGCHTPEEIENPGFTENRRMVAPVAVSGKYVDIKFSHIAHFKVKEQFGINCTTCHYAIPRSTSLADLSLPRMLDCVECHQTSKTISAEFRMSNCTTCHANTARGLSEPGSHTIYVKPAFHTESFRVHHYQEASSPDAKCFVCHQNVTPRVEATNQCAACHAVMKPVSNTARWKDDIHGKYAALERTPALPATPPTTAAAVTTSCPGVTCPCPSSRRAHTPPWPCSTYEPA